MTPERWRRITEVFQLALARDGAARDVVALDDACGSDLTLRADVEAMLAADDAAADFGEAPVPAAQAMPQFAPGARLGQYQIKALIGAGGMGEVYRMIRGWTAMSRSRVRDGSPKA